jgi:hypothetical protein
MKRRCSAAVTLALSVLGSRALGQVPPPNEAAAVRLEEPPRWSAALGAYGGLGLHFGSDLPIAHDVGGARLGLTVRHAELGAYAELTELPGGYQDTFGGSVGGYLPMHNFVDLHGGVGMGLRRYSDCRVGSGCAQTFSTPAASVRIGISDRTGGRLGVRVGCELKATYDFARKAAHWTVPVGPEGGISGVSHYGGASIVLLMGVALDLVPAA